MSTTFVRQLIAEFVGTAVLVLVGEPEGPTDDQRTVAVRRDGRARAVVGGGL